MVGDGKQFVIHFFITFIPRIIITSIQVNKVKSRKDGFKTIILGGSEKALSCYNELVEMPKSTGNDFIGFVNLNGVDKLLEGKIPYLGHVSELEKVLPQIEKIIDLMRKNS